MIKWFAWIWKGTRDDLFKKDDDLLLPLYHDGKQKEEEEEEDNEVESEEDMMLRIREKELAFATRVFKSAYQSRDRELNFYFDMFRTCERVERNEAPVTIWWMAHDHPYTRELMEGRATVWKLQRKILFTPYRPRESIYGFTEDILEKVVEHCITLCSKYELIKIHEDKLEEGQEQQPSTVSPASVEPNPVKSDD